MTCSATVATHPTQEPGNIIRQQLEKLLHESMQCIDVRNVLTHQVGIVCGTLQIGGLSYPLGEKRHIVLVAVGKAAVPMCSVIGEILRPELRDDQTMTGVAVGPESEYPLPVGIEYIRGSHPFPDQNSLNAADAVAKLLRPLDENDLILFLISGGASSMLETPLDSSICSEEVFDFHRSLVYSGLPITRMNALRKHFSAVKGGRLAVLAAPAAQCTLIISDVPAGAFDMVGSGPSLPDSSTVGDCLEILRQTSLKDTLSAKILKYFLERPLEETPKAGDAAFDHSGVVCLLSNHSILDHASRLAQEIGYYVEVDNTCDDWDYRKASDYLVAKVRKLRQVHKKVCVISGGEVSVKVSGETGIGGRNQHFALYTAMQLACTAPYIAMLSAGSDGVDGNSPAAGAFVDNHTALRSQQLELNISEAFERFDSYPLFRALGDAIVTGPTGNNVRDIRIFLSA